MSSSHQLYYRLIALWVLCEALLGGIIHGLKLPVSGLIVGSCAVLCISLIARYIPHRGVILQATLLVAIFKMLLSPQSPLPAYFAVFFQGLLGEILFFSRRFYALSCLLLGIFALTESGVQRILVVTLLYGKDFWQAVNLFINSFIGQQNPATPTNYAWYLAAGYIAVHALIGLFVGLTAAVVPQKLKEWHKKYKPIYNGNNNDSSNDMAAWQPHAQYSNVLTSIPHNPKPNQRRWVKNSFLIIWLCLLLLYIQSYAQMGGRAWLPQNVVATMLLRSLFLLLTWYFLLSPLLTYLLKKWLQYRQHQSKNELQEISHALPQIRALAALAWQQTTALQSGRRVLECVKIIICYVIHEPSEP